MYKKKLTLISLIIIALIVFSSINISIEAKNIFPGRDNLKRYLDNSYSQLYCVMPSNAVVGQPIRITIQAWDWAERICKRIFQSRIVFSSTDAEVILPSSYSFKLRDRGIKTLENAITFNTPGIHYVILTDEINDIFVVSNPVMVTTQESEYKWYWGELHSHTIISDGADTLNHNFRYARDISMLDFCAITDHHLLGWTPQWKERALHLRMLTKRAVNKFYEPDRFVTILGWEYSFQVDDGGHYNVYFNTVNDAPSYALEAITDGVVELWSHLKEWKNNTGHDMFTVPHHLISVMSWNSDFYDSEVVPLVEIYQFKGSSEMSIRRGNPITHYRHETLESGHSVQDGLAKGYKFGFIAASDDHSGHPGHHPPIMRGYFIEPLSYLGPFFWGYTGLRARLEYLQKLLQKDNIFYYEPGGLTGVYAKDLTRDEIFNTLKDRRCIAVTNANRMLVDFTINNQGVGNGSEVYVPDVNSIRIINCSVAGTAPIVNVTVIKNNETFYVKDGNGADPHDLSNYMVNFTITDSEPITGISRDGEHNTGGRDFYYIRVMQTNRGFAWIGPIWVNPFNTN